MIKDNIKRINDSVNEVKSKFNIKYNIDLMAVSKTKPIDSILEAINDGQVLFGENRVLEAYNKFNDVILKDKKYELHLIGHLQRNKAKKAVEIASMIQSIDKIETLNVIEKFCKEKNKKMDFLVEVNTSLEDQKNGISPIRYGDFIYQILRKQYKYCNLRGLMTVGPFTDNESKIRKSFSHLFKLYNKTKDELNKDDFNIISMGMSNDYKIAIEEGSNMIRVGSLIFGSR
jgi:pyridoxal phosphate enzyme (YggS family)